MENVGLCAYQAASLGQVIQEARAAPALAADTELWGRETGRGGKTQAGNKGSGAARKGADSASEWGGGKSSLLRKDWTHRTWRWRCWCWWWSWGWGRGPPWPRPRRSSSTSWSPHWPPAVAAAPLGAPPWGLSCPPRPRAQPTAAPPEALGQGLGSTSGAAGGAGAAGSRPRRPPSCCGSGRPSSPRSCPPPPLPCFPPSCWPPAPARLTGTCRPSQPRARGHRSLLELTSPGAGTGAAGRASGAPDLTLRRADSYRQDWRRWALPGSGLGEATVKRPRLSRHFTAASNRQLERAAGGAARRARGARKELRGSQAKRGGSCESPARNRAEVRPASANPAERREGRRVRMSVPRPAPVPASRDKSVWLRKRVLDPVARTTGILAGCWRWTQSLVGSRCDTDPALGGALLDLTLFARPSPLRGHRSLGLRTEPGDHNRAWVAHYKRVRPPWMALGGTASGRRPTSAKPSKPGIKSET